MVDDDRFRPAPGEEIQFRSVRFHPRLLIPHRRRGVRTPNPCRHHRAHSVPKLGTPGAGHRQRRRRQHGEEEAGGVFLMTTAMRAADRQAAFWKAFSPSSGNRTLCASLPVAASTMARARSSAACSGTLSSFTMISWPRSAPSPSATARRGTTSITSPRWWMWPSRGAGTGHHH